MKLFENRLHLMIYLKIGFQWENFWGKWHRSWSRWLSWESNRCTEYRSIKIGALQAISINISWLSGWNKVFQRKRQSLRSIFHLFLYNISSAFWVTTEYSAEVRLKYIHFNKKRLIIRWLNTRYEFKMLSICIRWHENVLVFGISAVVIIAILGLVTLEKMSFLPKPITSLSSFTTNNKTMLQIMATTNVLALLACVVIPLVSIFVTKYLCGKNQCT